MRIQVFVTNGFTRVAEVTSYRRVTAIERDLETGSWEVLGITDGAVIHQVNRTPLLGIEIVDPEAKWWMAGPCDWMSQTFKSDGSVEVSMAGVDLMHHFDDRLEWPNHLDSEQWWAQSPQSFASTSAAILDVCSKSFGSQSIPARTIPLLDVFPPATPFGPARQWVATRAPLSALLRPWCEGADYSYRFWMNRNEFDQARPRLVVGPRRVSEVVLTPQSHGAVTITTRANRASLSIGMGAQVVGQPAGVRHVEFVDATNPTHWTARRIETTFTNPTLESDAALVTEAQAELSRNRVRIGASVPDFEVERYGVTTNIGDLIRVDAGGVEFVAPITMARLDGTPEGWRRSLSVGGERELTGADGAWVLSSLIGNVRSRLRRVEGWL